MKIIDAHHHLWNTRVLHYELFDSVPALRRPYLARDYENVAAANRVESSICVEAASAGTDGWKETLWLLDESRRAPVVAGITAWAPLEQPGLDSYLERLRHTAGARVAAVRRSFEFEPDEFPASEEVIAGARVLARFGYKCELVLFERSLQSAQALIQACPETEFILDHAGKPHIREGVDQPWRRNILAIARLPNVVCKISGLSTEADGENWRKEQLRPYIDHVLECFGWDRVLFGSDWPVCNLARGFEPWLEALMWATAWASEDGRRKLFSENAVRVFGLSKTEAQRAEQR